MELDFTGFLLLDKLFLLASSLPAFIMPSTLAAIELLLGSLYDRVKVAFVVLPELGEFLTFSHIDLECFLSDLESFLREPINIFLGGAFLAESEVAFSLGVSHVR